MFCFSEPHFWHPLCFSTRTFLWDWQTFFKSENCTQFGRLLKLPGKTKTRTLSWWTHTIQQVHGINSLFFVPVSRINTQGGGIPILLSTVGSLQSSSALLGSDVMHDGHPGQPSEKLRLPAQVPPGGRQRCWQRRDPGQPAGWISRVPLCLQ